MTIHMPAYLDVLQKGVSTVIDLLLQLDWGQDARQAQSHGMLPQGQASK